MSEAGSLFVGDSEMARLMPSEPVMPCRRLLKSCAMPPVNWPTASIFCALDLITKPFAMHEPAAKVHRMIGAAA